MTVARPGLFWIAISTTAIVALVLLRQILLPFAVGMASAYLLVPAVDRLERLGINRALAAVAVVLTLVVGLVGLMLVILPALVGEIRFFLEAFPRYLAHLQALVAETSRPWLEKIMGEEIRIEHSSAEIAQTMASTWLDDVLHSLWSGGQVLVSILSLLVVVPIVAIYLLVDWDRMIATVDGWLPPEHREDVRALGREIHDTVAGFVRGQIVICLILALFYATALKTIGLNHAVIIGLTAGMISFVPYLGAGTGFVIAMCVAIVQFWPDWVLLGFVGGVFLVGESLADYVLSPRIIGSRVKLHPVLLMLSLFTFGYLFGFLGLLIAIPLAASLGVILRFVIRQLIGGSEQAIAPARAGTAGRARPG